MRFLLFFLFFTPYLLASNFNRDERAAYLVQAIQAIDHLDQAFIKDSINFVDLLSRQCGSSFVEIKVSCLVESSRTYCLQKSKNLQEHCHRLMDIVMTNRIQESHFLSKRERYEIMRDHKNFRRVFDQRLAQRYGALTTHFVMSPFFTCRDKTQPCFVTSLDQFCQHMNAEGQITWQTCAAAIVWFVAKTG
ncbi:MAG: hypothetical protein ACOH5I_14365 [Oligoflexus sp.]